MFSNGINLFGQKIFSLEEMEFFNVSNVISFHSWGNGDFDCILIDEEQKEETVFFMKHSNDALTPVCSSLYNWIKEVIKEIQQKGTLLHPDDYLVRSEEGVYKDGLI